MKTRLLGILAGILCSGMAYGFTGPAAKQVTVTTNAFTNILAGSSTLQGILDWMDDNMMYDGSDYLLAATADTTYFSLAAGNTATAGTTNSFAISYVRTEQVITADAVQVWLSNALTATNGATLVLAGSVSVVTSYGAAASATNTVILPSPAKLGQVYLLVNNKASTNLLAVASSTTMDGPALLLSAGEMALLYATATNKWVGIGQ
jgi:hypothetical protein